VGQNANFLSGRAPGNPIVGVVLRNVSLTIDRWESWNYSHPDHDYRPTTAVVDLQPALTDGLFVENIMHLLLDDVRVHFNKAKQQPYWTNVCFNLTRVNYPVQQTNCSCE
jgi:hypothetical protein